MLLLAGMALVVGTGGAASAWLLLHLIAIVTNLAWFGHFSVEPALIIDSTLGVAALLVPIVGSVIIGLMARFGSDKIRGHGLPNRKSVVSGKSGSVRVELGGRRFIK